VAGNCELYNDLSVSLTGKFFEYRNDSRPSLQTVVFCALQIKLLVGNVMKQCKYYRKPLYRKMLYFVTLINATDIRLRTDINSLCHMTYTPHLKVFQTKRSTMYIQSAISDKLYKLDLTSAYSSCWGFSELKGHLTDIFQCTAYNRYN